MKRVVAAVVLTLAVTSCAHKSDGPLEVLIPDVTSQVKSEAIAALQAAGFANLLTQYVMSTTTPPDRVIKTIPPPGEMAALTGPISIAVSTGPIQR